jgi:predicted alpha/beta-fold hydrolase
MPLIPVSTYKGNPLIKNKHLETIIPALFRRISVFYEREKIITTDKDFVDLDWIKNGSSKLMILLHGLEGSSSSNYIKGFAQFFSKEGFDICAVNFRGCGGEDNLMLHSYHSGATGDIHDILRHIKRQQQYTEITLVGFSLGGNIVLKYLGEQGENVPPFIKCAVVFSVPCDLMSSAYILAEKENRIYTSRFLKTLTQKVKNKALIFPGKIQLNGIDRIRDFKEFDDRYTAPINGFKDAIDYWTSCSSIHFIKNIRIPTLLVNAKNDPFLSPACFPVEKANTNPDFYAEFPIHGGHVGFSTLFPNSTYWSEIRAKAFIQSYIHFQ